ncbi:type II secretion system protein GspD [bacterium]|nr:MAG: type II secretion system protein GspD [bacterium]
MLIKKYKISIFLVFFLLLAVNISAQDSTGPSIVLHGQNALSSGDFLDKTISLDLKDMDVTEALKFLAVKAGLNIIPTKEVTGRITLVVDNVSLRDVFDIMLRSNNLAYVKQGEIYNVMTEKEYKTLYGKNFFDMREVKAFHIQYAIPDQVNNLLSTIKSEFGKIIIDSESGTILVMDTPEKVEEMKATLAMMEQKSTIRIFNLKYARAKDIEEQLKSQLDVKKVGSIKADERTNQVVVQTFTDRMQDIANLIQSLDKKTKEILIDAKIVQVKLSNALSTGIEWEGLFNLGKKAGLTYLGSVPFAWTGAASTDVWRSRDQVRHDVGYVGSYPFSGTTSSSTAGKQSIATQEMHLGQVGKHDYDTIIKYLQTLGETRILSNPKLAVVNNQEAKIHVGERQAYVTTTKTEGQGTVTLSESVTYIDVGTQLFIVPNINDEGYVTLKIKPEVSSVVSYLTSNEGNKIPIVETSTAETTVMVKDGTSILVGGLSREEKVSTTQQTPLLGRIPILGIPFRSKSDTTTRTELLVLVTPHIISGDELTTGYDRDLRVSLDKQYQDYRGFTEESSGLEQKAYRDYPELKKDTKPILELKPARNF